MHDGPLQVPRSDNSHSLVAQISQWAQSNSHSLYSNAVDAGTTTIDTFAAILICLIATFFFLFDGPKISRFLIGLFLVNHGRTSPLPAQQHGARSKRMPGCKLSWLRLTPSASESARGS